MNTYTGDSDRAWDRFWQLIARADAECVAYVYRVDARGRAIRPFWMKASADYALVDAIQDGGGGRFRIIVRRRRTILLSDYFAFAGHAVG